MKLFTIMFLTLALLNCVLKMQTSYRFRMAAVSTWPLQLIDACIFLWIIIWIGREL